MINFNVPPFVREAMDYVRQAMESRKICGDGEFTRKCHQWLEERFNARKVLLTTSGTTALDMAAILCDFKTGDEVILPSYTFSSTATAFAIYGAKLVFVDIRPDTMNIDETKIEAAITKKTKAIVAMHYAGVACEMDTIMEIAKKYHLFVIEDAAQGVMSTYKGKALGTIGDFGCYSFHETKNYSMGEGGAVVINNPDYIERAEIIREKGTNRAKFFRGQVDKYTWVDIGDSFLPSELNAAYLWAQLLRADEINEDRMTTWNAYKEALKPLANAGMIELPAIPDGCVHNAHMFYIKCKDLTERTELLSYLKNNNIWAVFHYIPLHSAPAGLKYGRFAGEDKYTTIESDRLVRLPMYYGMTSKDRQTVIDAVFNFYKNRIGGGYCDKTESTVLFGFKVILRPINAGDTNNIVRWRNNPKVRKNFLFRETFTEEMHTHWLNTKVASGEVVQFIIEEKDTQRPVGSVYFRDINSKTKSAEYGIFIGEDDAVNQGYGTEAARLFVHYGFEQLKLHRIFLRLIEGNDRAYQSYLAAGFQKEGIARDAVILDGKPFNIIFMSRLDSD